MQVLVFTYKITITELSVSIEAELDSATYGCGMVSTFATKQKSLGRIAKRAGSGSNTSETHAIIENNGLVT